MPTRTWITEHRKALGLTQTDLGQELGVPQQTIAHYEGGTARIATAMLPTVARVLGVSIEELIGMPASSGVNKRGLQPKIALQLQQIEALPKTKQRAIAQGINHRKTPKNLNFCAHFANVRKSKLPFR